MKEFLHYFFGQGTEIEFRNFTLAHFLPVILLFVVLWATWKFRDNLRDYKHEHRIRMALAFMLIISEMSYYWRLVGMPELGPNPIDHLPITVCGWCSVFCSYMMFSKNQWLFDISYFWLLSGSVFALITPTVISYAGPTRFRYYQFWIQHTMGYVAVFYMIFVHKMRPNLKGWVRAAFWLAVLAVIAYYTNVILGPGANYLFMAEPESTPSVLDLLPPNFALRICVMTAVILLMQGLAYLPWYLKDRKAAKQMQSVK